MATQRIHDEIGNTWEIRLHGFIDSRVGVPFEWGTNDCCLFVADAIQAMTGTDPAEAFRGKYSDQAGAVAAIKEVCGGESTEDAIAWVAEQQGWEELPNVLFAQRGDMVVLEGDEGSAAGIVYLNGKDALFVSSEGLKRRALAECKRAWRVS